MKSNFLIFILIQLFVSFCSFGQYPDAATLKANKIGMVIRYAEQGTDYFLYDENGWEVKVSMSDPEFKRTYRDSKIYYNAAQNPDSIIVTGQFNNYKEYYRYNANGSYDVISIERGTTDTVFYGKNKKAIRSSSSDGSSAKYEYNPQGQLVRLIRIKSDGSKSQTSYVYNAAGKIQLKKYDSGDKNSIGANSTSFEYDKRGLMIKEVNNYSTSKFSTSYEYKPMDAALLAKTKEEVKPEPVKPIARELPAFSAGDITPETKSDITYNFPASDDKNNLYVVKTISYTKGSLWKYDGKHWNNISADANGWDYVYDMKVDKNGNIYLYGKSAASGILINRYSSGKWDSIPTAMLNGNVRSLSLTRNMELLARGKFNNETGPYYLAKYHDGNWSPVGQEIKDKFLKKAFSEFSGSRVAEDGNGNLYVEIFRYNKPGSRSYIAKWDGQQWTLLDTTANKFDATIPEMVVTKNSQLFFPGHIKNEKDEYSMARWNGQKWEMISTYANGFSKDYLESVALDNDDNVYAGGWMKKNYEYAVAKWTAGAGWESYAASDEYITKIVVTPLCIFATTGSGKRVYCFTPGSTVKQGKLSVANAGGQSTTSSTGTSTVKAEEKKDAKASEVWQIFESYRTTYKEKYKTFLVQTNQVFERDEKGNYKNQVVWKSLGYYIKQEAASLQVYVDGYRKQLGNLSLKERENELNDAFMSYLNYSYGYLSAVSSMMDDLKYSIVTPEAKRSVDDVNAMRTEVDKKIDKLNPILTPYKKRNGIF